MDKFQAELRQLINKHSIENEVDMPDYLLADLLCDFIKTLGTYSKRNLDWHGCDSVCHPKRDNDSITLTKTLTNED